MSWLSAPLALSLALVASSVLAVEEPIESVSMIWVWAFLILFVGCLGMFGWMIWRNEKRSKAAQSGR